jgi:3',5'-cyclic AMP phosphodiesterase CpdA
LYRQGAQVIPQMKFVYIADTHIGCREGAGYQMQPRYGGACMEELFGVLADWVRQEVGVDFVVHGGDAVDTGMPENLALARKYLGKMPCPVYLTLGNHDLTESGARSQWLQIAPELFPGGNTEASHESAFDDGENASGDVLGVDRDAVRVQAVRNRRGQSLHEDRQSPGPGFVHRPIRSRQALRAGP